MADKIFDDDPEPSDFEDEPEHDWHQWLIDMGIIEPDEEEDDKEIRVNPDGII